MKDDSNYMMDEHAGLRPANVDAEKTILGAVLLDNNALIEASEKLEAGDFSLDSHRRIFQRMIELSDARHQVDIVTLSNELARWKEIEAVGGVAYLASLTEGLPRRPAIIEYLRIVKDKALLRSAMMICSRAIARAQDQAETALDVIGELQSDLDRAADRNLAGTDLETIGQWRKTHDIFAERPWGIRTGIDELDELTFGLRPEELTVIAARTSMGKTAFACNLTANVARRGQAVAAFINEQSKESFYGRMLCSTTAVPFKSYVRGTLDAFERDYIRRADEDFQKYPIFWDYRSSMSVRSIRTKSTRLKRSGELDLIIVDQLSRVNNDGFDTKGRRGDEIIGDKVGALKELAVDLRVPVVLFVQVGRGAVKNAGARPTLADLAESGKIEQHADNVHFLHRPKYFDRKSEEDDEIITGKQRDGEIGTSKVEFVGACCRWQNKGRK